MNDVTTILRADLRFHWKFWAPVDCIGGKVILGHYYECGGFYGSQWKTVLMTVEQYERWQWQKTLEMGERT